MFEGGEGGDQRNVTMRDEEQVKGFVMSNPKYENEKRKEEFFSIISSRVKRALEPPDSRWSSRLMDSQPPRTQQRIVGLLIRSSIIYGGRIDGGEARWRKEGERATGILTHRMKRRSGILSVGPVRIYISTDSHQMLKH
ncbi:hypothetical protein EVAR_44856_1 [Eumeta japonica]|uniref:Uncharacterized protein n=1 Tax=Eumeta variegata TaxID=151549 RepID=A0A4C1ZMX3_EUMVA|nr:hypothetical protein EVAR_44856_1 [Eumeta japonica]